MNPQQAHRSATLMFSLAMIVIGVALIAQVINGHDGIVSPRMLLGLLFIAAGGARIYLEAKKGRARP
jgi:predicted membrane channel-forming protein YqfA (hemolysin III family)